jgi:hypothetical protein
MAEYEIWLADDERVRFCIDNERAIVNYDISPFRYFSASSYKNVERYIERDMQLYGQSLIHRVEWHDNVCYMYNVVGELVYVSWWRVY